MRSLIFVVWLSLLCLLPHAEEIILGTINGDKVNIRSDSTIFSDSLGTLQQGDTVRIVKTNLDWCRIILPRNFSGYVHRRYLALRNLHYVVTANNLNIRIKPSLDGAIVGKLTKNEIVKVVTIEGEWVKIDPYPHASAWVHKKFIDLGARDKDKPINP